MLDNKKENINLCLYNIMVLLNIIHRAIDFGTFRARENFFSFALKCLLFIIPAVILGNFTDITITKMKNYKALDDRLFYYILLQTLIIITTLYIILKVLTSYISEFQVTIAGGLFSIFYFGIQTNYIKMLKAYTSY
jgi:hypothetical protein